MTPRSLLLLIIVFCLTAAKVDLAVAQSGGSELGRLTTTLQTNPSDRALRERIIKLGAEMKPAPEIPREAKEQEGAAEYFAGLAKNEADFAKAAAEYEKAALLAPWSASAYYNAGLLYEKAKQPERSLLNYEFYLLAAPNSADSEAVIRKVGAMKAAAKIAAAQRAADEQARRDREAAAERERQRTGGLREFRRLVEGKVYRVLLCRGYDGCTEDEFHGKNWTTMPYVSVQPTYSWLFEGDAAYLHSEGSRHMRVTSNGANLSDLVWEIRYSNDKPFQRPGGFFQVSSDFFQILTGWRAPQKKERTQFFMYKTP